MTKKTQTINLDAFAAPAESAGTLFKPFKELAARVDAGKIAILMVVVFVLALINLTIMFGVVVIVIYFMLFKLPLRKASPRLSRFADDNNLTYKHQLPYKSTGRIFTVGNPGHETWDMLSSKLDGLAGYPYNIYEHVFRVGRGNNIKRYNYLVLELMLPKRLPHIYIDTKSNNNFLGLEALDQFISQDLWQLEGDFSKDFNVYAPKVYAPDVLTLLNPAFMVVLQDSVATFDLEFIDDRAFMYFPNFERWDESVIFDVYTYGELIALELAKQLDTFQFNPSRRSKKLKPKGQLRLKNFKSLLPQ